MNKIGYLTCDQFLFYLNIASSSEQSAMKGKADYTIFNKNSFYVPYETPEKCNGSLFCVINSLDYDVAKMPFDFIENMAKDLLIPSSKFYDIIRCFSFVKENISDPYDERSERVYLCASLEDVFNVIKECARIPSDLLQSYEIFKDKKDAVFSSIIENIKKRLKDSTIEDYYHIEITNDSLTYKLFNRKYFQLKNRLKPDILYLFNDVDFLLKTKEFSNVEKGKIVFNDVFDIQTIMLT